MHIHLMHISHCVRLLHFKRWPQLRYQPLPVIRGSHFSHTPETGKDFTETHLPEVLLVD